MLEKDQIIISKNLNLEQEAASKGQVALLLHLLIAR